MDGHFPMGPPPGKRVEGGTGVGRERESRTGLTRRKGGGGGAGAWGKSRRLGRERGGGGGERLLRIIVHKGGSWAPERDEIVSAATR